MAEYNVRELCDALLWLIADGHGESAVVLEAGGDGAIHYGPICSVRKDDDHITLSTEWELPDA